MPKPTSTKRRGKKKQQSTSIASVPSIAKVFHSWKDEDFFGPKATHVFFYGDIESNNVHDFRLKLAEASKSVKSVEGVTSKPKPIVIHVHSPGGNAELGLTMANFLREIPVPTAVVVDGYACSAVTPMLVSAAYRVMHEFSFVMFHEGSMGFGGYVRDSELNFINNEILFNINKEYTRVYEQNTQLPKDKLEDMLSRDIFMNAEECLRHKVVDRKIKLDRAPSIARWSSYIKAYPDMDLTRDPLTWKVNMNHLYNYDVKAGVTASDNLLKIVRKMNIVMNSNSDSDALPIVLHTNYYIAPRSYWHDIATLMVHTNSMSVPVIGVIDNTIDLLRAIPCIMAYKRYMYDNAYVVIRLVYEHQKNVYTYYHDIKHNTDLIRTCIVSVLKQYTKLPSAILDTLFDKRIMLSAKECKEYGIVDDIIPSYSRRRSAQSGGAQCSCSQGLSLNPPPDFDF